MKPLNLLDHWVGGTRDGRRHGTGGAWPDPDSATRCHGARWEMAYSPRTCMTCRLHVRLHDMEIVTRQFGPCVRGFRAGRHPHEGLSRLHGADARGWLTITHLKGCERAPKPLGRMGRRAERIVFGPPPPRPFTPAKWARSWTGGPNCCGAACTLIARSLAVSGIPCPASGERTRLVASMPGPRARRGRVSPWRTPMRRIEPAGSRARRRGLSDAAKAGEPPGGWGGNARGAPRAPDPTALVEFDSDGVGPRTFAQDNDPPLAATPSSRDRQTDTRGQSVMVGPFPPSTANLTVRI